MNGSTNTRLVARGCNSAENVPAPQLGFLVDPNAPEELVKAIADVLCHGSSRQRK